MLNLHCAVAGKNYNHDKQGYVMPNQEQSSSNRSSSPNQDRTDTLLQKYANTNLDALPARIIQELEEENFLGVDISGAMNLTDISRLPQQYLEKTLTQSLNREEEPFNNKKSKNFLAALNIINPEMSLENVFEFIDIIADANFIENLPIYFHDKCNSLAKNLKEKKYMSLSEKVTNSDPLALIGDNKKEIIDEFIQLKKECDYFKARWEIINSIQEIINRGKNTLKIPSDYPYDIPVYLDLLSDTAKSSINILVTNNTSIDNKIKIKDNLSKFGIKYRLFSENAATSVNREVESQGLLGVLPVSQQSSAQQLQSPHQEILTTSEDELEDSIANWQPLIPPVFSPRRDQFTSTAGDPGTESSVDSMRTNAGTDHSFDEQGNTILDNEEEHGPAAVFQPFVQHQAAFDSSVLERRLYDIDDLVFPNIEKTIINPALY